jgi:hypothetical protein
MNNDTLDMNYGPFGTQNPGSPNYVYVAKTPTHQASAPSMQHDTAGAPDKIVLLLAFGLVVFCSWLQLRSSK